MRSGLLVVVLLTACATTSADGPKKDVETLTGAKTKWDANAWENDETSRAIDALLARELTADGAVEVALLANPRVRSMLEDLSIAQAELVTAGVLKNPVVTFGATAWDSDHINPNLFLSVEQDFLDVLALPLRKRVAGAELEAKKLEVGDDVLALAADIRTAYFQAQSSMQLAAVRRLVEEAAEAGAELAKKQHEAGNISDLALGTELALASRAKLDRMHAEADAVQTRERLTKSMGLWGPRTSYRIPPRLADLPAEDPSGDLETVAMQHQLGVKAARSQVEMIDRMLTLAKTTRWTGTITAGVEIGRLRSGRFGFGPRVSVEIPLFDQRRGAIAKLEAMKRKSEDNLQSLAIDARSDVRAALARVHAARTIALEYRASVVPLRDQNVKLAEQEQGAMLLGLYQLIETKQSAYEAYRDEIEATRDYWIARADLDRAVSARLPR